MNKDEVPFEIALPEEEVGPTLPSDEEQDTPPSLPQTPHKEEDLLADGIPVPETDAATEDDKTDAEEEPTVIDLLRHVVGGDAIFGFIRKHIGFILFLAALAFLYISNRFAAQQEIIELAHLHKQLEEQKNYTLTKYLELTMFSRQSNLEELLRQQGYETLQTSNEPPFFIVKK